MLFEKILQVAVAFNYKNCPYQLDHLDGHATCLLSEVVKPLQWITEQLMKQVIIVRDVAIELNRNKSGWEIICRDYKLVSKNIILAHGAEENIISPTSTSTSISISSKALPSLNMTTALNPELLAKTVSSEDIIAVYGAPHSAVLIVKNLLDLDCSVINLYRHPLKYAIYQQDHIIYDNTGLKALAAQYAKQHMDTQLHPKLTRCYLESDQAKNLLSTANKTVYAIGFHANYSLTIEGVDIKNYDVHTGI